MSAYIELCILYVVLFLPATLPGNAPADGPPGFSVTGELVRIFLYNIPSLALVWYLLLKHKPGTMTRPEPPGRKDLIPFLCAFPSLALIGFSIASAAPVFSELPPAGAIAVPLTLPAWIILPISCLSTGYLEESFFRYYLLSKRGELRLGASQSILFSALLFALCHIYEGPWGFLNAALSGIVLAFVFVRYRSLHGIALAHGLYNICAYAVATLEL
jgi:membrane protease YdiL (CAAX protease family)